MSDDDRNEAELSRKLSQLWSDSVGVEAKEYVVYVRGEDGAMRELMRIPMSPAEVEK